MHYIKVITYLIILTQIHELIGMNNTSAQHRKFQESFYEQDEVVDIEHTMPIISSIVNIPVYGTHLQAQAGRFEFVILQNPYIIPEHFFGNTQHGTFIFKPELLYGHLLWLYYNAFRQCGGCLSSCLYNSLFHYGFTIEDIISTTNPSPLLIALFNDHPFMMDAFLECCQNPADLLLEPKLMFNTTLLHAAVIWQRKAIIKVIFKHTGFETALDLLYKADDLGNSALSLCEQNNHNSSEFEEKRYEIRTLLKQIETILENNDEELFYFIVQSY